MLTQNSPILEACLRNWERSLLLLAHEGQCNAAHSLPEEPSFYVHAPARIYIVK